MRTAFLAVALAIAGLASAGRAAPPAPGGAGAFLHRIYSHYPHRPGASAFDPVGRSAPAVFDPSMVALIRENLRLTPKGDAPDLDGDPLCDCQDDAGMKVRIGAISLTDPGRATASVDLDLSGEHRHLGFDLTRVGSQWRVHDIHTRDTPSLRAYLVKSNAALKAHR